MHDSPHSITDCRIAVPYHTHTRKRVDRTHSPQAEVLVASVAQHLLNLALSAPAVGARPSLRLLLCAVGLTSAIDMTHHQSVGVLPDETRYLELAQGTLEGDRLHREENIKESV